MSAEKSRGSSVLTAERKTESHPTLTGTSECITKATTSMRIDYTKPRTSLTFELTSHTRDKWHLSSRRRSSGLSVLILSCTRPSRQLDGPAAGRFLQPYDTRIMDILRVNYGGSQNEVKHENGPFWQSGKMAYHCPRCNAGYTYKKTLKTHMKYDCGKEPRFKCPYCSKRDKCSSNIYKHIRMRHNGKPVYVDRLESSRSSTSSIRDSSSAIGQSS